MKIPVDYLAKRAMSKYECEQCFQLRQAEDDDNYKMKLGYETGVRVRVIVADNLLVPLPQGYGGDNDGVMSKKIWP